LYAREAPPHLFSISSNTSDKKISFSSQKSKISVQHLHHTDESFFRNNSTTTSNKTAGKLKHNTLMKNTQILITHMLRALTTAALKLLS